MSWFELMCRGLRRDDLSPVDSPVPFAISAETQVSWQEPKLVERGDRAWELAVGSPQGLEATWRVREHPDTRALECSGSVRNAGRVPLDGVRELRTLDLTVGLSEAWGEPFVRTIAGVRLATNHFPPDDFRFRDRQLLRVPKVYTPFSVAAWEAGYSSGDNLPCAILGGEAGDRGLALFYEWSGLWSIGVEQVASPSGAPTWPWALRIKAGIWGMALDLKPGEELPLPNLLITGYEGDLDAGGNALRRHIGQHIAPTIGDSPALPPVSFNHWFSFENDYTAASLKPTAEACAAAGVEYFCVDAGWFPGGFRGGLGNWSDCDPAKFPDGMPAFSRWLGDRELKLGLWFEPEFAHVESEIYRAHPEWFLTGPHISPWSTPGEWFYEYEGSTGVDTESDMIGERFGLIDFGQPEARQWCIDRFVEAYERWDLRWVRWDCNQMPRPHWDMTAPSGRVGINQINHVTGLYDVLDEIRRACPELFLEQCAAGGLRIDLGTVRRGHAFWMNDHTIHTDVVRALQQGLNTVLPGIYANTNLCQERFDYDDYDYLSHGCGSFGFSGKLDEAPKADFERYCAAVERFKSYRHLLGGDYERSTGNPGSPSEHAYVAWNDGSETVEMEFNANGPRSVELKHHEAN